MSAVGVASVVVMQIWYVIATGSCKHYCVHQALPSRYRVNIIAELEHRVSCTTQASAKEIAEDAAALLEDVRQGRILEAQVLAGLSSGRNGRRAFSSLIDSMDYGLQPYESTFTCLDPGQISGRVSRVWPVLLPHEIISALYACGWEIFSNVMLRGVPESTNIASILG